MNAFMKTGQKGPKDKRCLLILDLKAIRSQAKGRYIVGREFQFLAV